MNSTLENLMNDLEKYKTYDLFQNKNNYLLYMTKLVLSKTVHSDWFFLSRDFAVRNAVQAVYFCFGAKQANSKFATKTVKKC